MNAADLFMMDKNQHNMTTKPKKMFSLSPVFYEQLLIAEIPVLLFLLGGMTAVRRNGETISFGVYLALFLLIFLLVWNAGKCRLEYKTGKTGPVVWLRAKGGLLFLLSVSLLLRLPQMETMVRNDSAAYYAALYRACKNFTFDLSYFLSSFRLAAHPSYGYAALLAVAEFFRPGRFENIWLIQTALSLGAIFCVYDIVREQKRIGEKGAFWIGLLTGCCPMFLGLDSYLQLDFGCTVFFCFVLWAFFRKKLLLLIFGSLILIFSKEFGIALLCGFFAGVVFYEVIFVEKGPLFGRAARTLRRTENVVLAVLCLLGGIGVLFYLFGPSMGWLGEGRILQGQAEYLEGSARGYLGFDGRYILDKFGQCWCVNFGWLSLLLAGLGGVRRFLAKRKGRERDRRLFSERFAVLCSGIAGASLIYFFCSCLVVTYPIPRYNLPIQMAITLLSAVVFVGAYGGKEKLTGALCLSVSLLYILQAYVTVDPVMLTVYRNVDTGSMPLVTCNEEGSWKGDYLIYNYQYTYLDRCIRDAFRTAGADAETDIIVLGSNRGIALGSGGRGWNIQAGDWRMLEEPGTLELSVYESAEDPGLQGAYEKGLLKDKAIFLETAFNDGRVGQESQQTLFEHYKDVKKFRADSFGGAITYYTAVLVR